MVSQACNSARAVGYMTKHCLTVSLISVFLVSAEASSQIKLSDIFKRIKSTGISENEAGRGIKEALAQGVTKAVLNLHRTDGFLGSDIYTVVFPPYTRQAGTTHR